jgi:hypothetical protein
MLISLEGPWIDMILQNLRVFKTKIQSSVTKEITPERELALKIPSKYVNLIIIKRM